MTFADDWVIMLPSHLYGVFKRLQNHDFFSRVTVTNGYVSCPDEIALAPDAIYKAIKNHGEWILN